MQDAKEEVRARLDIEDVIGEYVQLKRAGRNLKGLSPFSNEKTPSFMVSPDKNIWHDFSSNKGGDIYTFIMEVEGLDFVGALELLARKAGVDLTMYNKGDKKIASDRKKAVDLNTLANKYYQHSLANNQRAMDYVFNERKMTKEIVRQFGVGYAPSTGKALVNFLHGRKFKTEDIQKAGLLNRFNGDLFRQRMTVALMDQSGQVIGFTARQLKNEPNSPKYLNTPQTVVYDKGRHVFGLSQAKESIRKEDFVVIAEGNMDVIASHQVGVTNVVATAGTAMTLAHLKTLARFTRKIKLAFDGDQAGLNATERAIELSQGMDIDLFIVSLPDDVKDPDELIQKDPNLWKEAVSNEKPAIDWVISQYYQKENLKTAIGKRNFINATLKLVRLIEDPVLTDYYLKKIGDLSEISKGALREKLATKTKAEQQSKKIIKAKPQEALVADETQFEDNILGLALINNDFTDKLPPNLADFMSTPERQQLADFMVKNPQTKAEEIEAQLQNIEIYVKILLLRAEERYNDWSKENQADEMSQLLHQLDERKRKQKKLKLTKQLKEAELLGDETEAAKIRQQLNVFIKESHGR